jgi:hypothetical protein
MKSMYDNIVRFMEDYFTAYSEYGQVAETHHIMDKFYAPDLVFDEGVVTSREQWYERCLAHPNVQDKLTLEHLYIDEKQKEVGALLRTQAIVRATGEVLVELKMNVLYNLKIDQNKDIKITKVKVFPESDPVKVAKLFQAYAMDGKKPQQK